MSKSNINSPRIANDSLEIIKARGLKMKKSLGQNFLTDSHVMNKIINAADISPDDLIIEVGPGIGGLTQELAERAGHVVAIEIDTELIPVLKQNLVGYSNVEIINADILKTDVAELIRVSQCVGDEDAEEKSIDNKDIKTGKVKFVANLPYYITTPIIMGLLEDRVPLDSIIVMVQKEVAHRMCAKPGTKDYGALTLAVSYYAEAYLVANVPQNCFVPRPNVDSAVIKLTLRDKPPVAVSNEALMFEIIKAAFSMRRKTLVNCLHNAELTGLSKEKLNGLVECCGMNADIRGENLTLEQYAVLTEAVAEIGYSK